jgi:hypothetical protein
MLVMRLSSEKSSRDERLALRPLHERGLAKQMASNQEAQLRLPHDAGFESITHYTSM